MQVLKDFVGRLKLLCDIDTAMIDKLQDLDDRLATLEQSHEKTRKMSSANCSRLAEIQQLLGSRRDK